MLAGTFVGYEATPMVYMVAMLASVSLSNLKRKYFWWVVA
jgi:hypothetical protein